MTYDPSTPEDTNPYQQHTGASWTHMYPKGSIERIHSRATWQDAQTQAQVETVVLLHSIRRILIWTMVIIPIVAAIAVGVMFGAPADESTTTNPYY